MHAAAPTPPLPAHEPWLYGADRRLDLLAVPAFHAAPAAVAGWHAPRRRRAAPLQALSTHWPHAALPLAAHLAGQALAPALPPLPALLLLLRHLASPSRFEPLNTYPLHRDVPSPRGSFPLQLQLLLRGAQGPAKRYAYRPEHHALEPLGADAAAQALAAPGGCTVLVVAPFWALADKYGEFAPYAQILEAGMLQAQLQHLVAALGWQGAPLAAAELAAATAPQPWEAPAWGWRGQAPGLAEAVAALPLQAARVADSVPAHDLATRFPRLAALAAAFAPRADEAEGHGPAGATAAASGWAAPPEPQAGPELFTLMRRRSAGNDAPGMAPRLAPLPPGSHIRLLATTRALASRRGAWPGEARLQPVLAWLDGRAALHTLAGEPLPTPGALAEVLQSALPNPGLRWNLRAFKAALIVTAPPAAAHAPGALRQLHLAAGALAQDFSLAATAEGLAARPMRMLAEQALQRGLGLAGLPLYAVLCACNRSTNLAWELL